MPLLRKKVFEKQAVPDYLRDDEEVFYCEITNEIFRDYHDFSERMFLCNSMVWTCSMTGKSNLTYLEAVESEEHARQCLKEFPTELKLPILYLATLTKRTFFGEMAEDIFCYAKDRYFIGENVEACFTANKWKDCHILSVIPPPEEQYKHELKNSGNHSPSERFFVPSANLYKYEIEHLDADDNDISEIMIVDSTQLRRKKIHFSRDKSKLFLKQHVEQDSRGIFVIKSTDLERYNIKNIKWDTIFGGPLPNFQSSKNFDKAVNGTRRKKQRQETLSKYLEKNGLVMKKEGQQNKEKKNNLLEQMKKREEEFKKQKQLNDEQKALERQRKKVENMKLAQYFREWSKLKDDLELEDQMKLPIPAPVKCKVPDKYFGDMLAVLEFVHNFPKLLSTKDFFPGGFTLEIIQRALTEKEVAGPLTDLIQMLLVAIFNCQEEESNNYKTDVETLKEINKEKLSTTPSAEEGTHLATLASKWPVKYQGLPISRLPLYSLTVSEILRLHLLSSGARIKETGTKWRYGLRGGYTSEDDPGLFLRLNHAHILKALAIHNVVQLSINDKIKIISCLMNQILTYADVRDVIEDRIEKVRQTKSELKSARIAEKKREVEYVSQRTKLKKEIKDDAPKLQAALDALESENSKKQATNQKKIEKFLKTCNEGQLLLGRDRAYRKYLRFDSVPGVFVNWEDELAGTCLDKITVQYPELASCERSQLMNHIRKLHEVNHKREGSKSPSKSPKKVNGIRKSVSAPDSENCIELFMCTADPMNCPVHKVPSNRQKWSFFHEKEQLEDLIKVLNKRGYRESELKDSLKCDEEKLFTLIAKTPVNLLNPEIPIKIDETEERPVRANGSNKKKDRYEDANLGYPAEMKSEEVLDRALVENILEMEEKITAGALGSLKAKDREKWRNCLQNKDYDEFQKFYTNIYNNNKENKLLKVKKAEKARSRSSTPEISDKDKKEEKEYEDPGGFLGATLAIESEDSDNDRDDIVFLQAESIKLAIQSLAMALCHIAQAVDPKYLKRPLGHADVRPSNKHKDEYDVLERWEQSLLASTSFSQVFLHYGTLDSCVMWSRSALLARCQICRRQKDSENMLLCDSCNLGHHMYCLKPKLTSVPKGDWFCDRCKKEKEKQEKLLSPEPVKKRRRIFVEEEVDEEDDQDSGNEEGGDEEEEESSDEEEMSVDDEDEEDSDLKVELCKTCGSGGEIVTCDKCLSSFHKECITPPLRRLPRSPWTCPPCSSKGKNESRSREKARENGYHSDDFENDEVVQRRSLRRDEKRDDLPLHNAALQELLSDVMKHETAWPFLRPVHLKEVPDYYDIITEPMDFGTIKYKLNMGEYSTDSQLMRDVVLVFDNCNTYNSNADEVYKLGVQLLGYFSKKAKELGLAVPPELEHEEDAAPKTKKRRTK